MVQLKDYYAILDLPPQASRAEIKRAYRRLAMIHHPDKTNGNPYSASYFHDIKEAYETLMNPVKKEHYLQQRWYFHSRGHKFKDYKPLTPEGLLEDVISLNKYVHTLNAFRVDRVSLFNYINNLLNPTSLEMLRQFDNKETNRQVVILIMDATLYLDLERSRRIADLLKVISLNDQVSLSAIDKNLLKKRTSALFERFELAAVVLITLLILLLMWLAVD